MNDKIYLNLANILNNIPKGTFKYLHVILLFDYRLKITYIYTNWTPLGIIFYFFLFWCFPEEELNLSNTTSPSVL